MPERGNDEWTAILDRMEADIVSALKQLEDTTVPAPEASSWSPPLGASPMPPGFEERARLLLETQAEVTGRLAAAKRQAAQHLSAVSRIPEPDRLRESIYLDVTG